MVFSNVSSQEATGDQQLEKSPTETEVEKEEEGEEEEYNGEGEEEDGDVQSFVTALENENDHVADSLNDLRLGHDDDGKRFILHTFILAIFRYFPKVGSLHRMSDL